MKKILLLTLLYLATFASAFAAEDIVGFWKSINDENGKPQILVAVYEYEDKYFGRILATYDQNGIVNESIEAPKSRAPGIIGHPYYCGLDLICNLKKNGSKFKGGTIVDPKKGKEYHVELWTDNGNLIVRGKLLFFGRNQTWLPASAGDFPPKFKKPDLTKLVPSVPQVDEGS